MTVWEWLRLGIVSLGLSALTLGACYFVAMALTQ
jgi:hypothetical protein